MKTIVGLFAAAALVGLATSAAAQPPGSYRDSCRDIRIQGSVLTALCRRAGGRGEQLVSVLLQQAQLSWVAVDTEQSVVRSHA